MYVIVIKTAQRRSNLLKTINCFTRNIRKHRFQKKSDKKFPVFSIWKMLLAFLQKPCQCCHENGGDILHHFYVHSERAQSGLS